MTEKQFQVMLRGLAAESSWRQLGDQLGCSGQYLHRVASGLRPASASLAEKLGYRKVQETRYEPLR